MTAFGKRQEEELHRNFIVAAASTAEIINIIGAAHSSKDTPWVGVSAKDLFEQWTGTSTAPVVDQEYIEGVLRGIKEREASVKFMGQ